MKNSLTYLALAVLLQMSGYAQLTTLYNFVGTNLGSNPYGTPITDGTYLYGLTQAGGINARGNIFKIKLDGTGYTNMFDFDGLNGAYPHGSLISDGTYLYGMTRNGGASFVFPSVQDNGVVFKIKLDGTGYTVIYEFDGTTSSNNINGSMPNGGDLLIIGQTLYGMTGAKDVVFKVNTDGTNFARLFDFSSPNGQYPLGSLITDGTYLYGVTEGGGSNNWGTIFKIKTDGTAYANVFEFYNTLQYSNPHGTLLSDGTNFYGMAVNCVYKIKTDGTGFDTIVKFRGANGSLNNFNTFAQNSLITDGTYLYGITNEGGANNKGCVFKIKFDGTNYTKLADFTGTNGQTPYGSLLLHNGDLYGMTAFGGTFSKGVIYKIANPINSINENSSIQSIKLHPNPANDVLNFDLINSNINDKEYDVVIINSTGQVALQLNHKSNTQINISELNQGLYFVTIINNENRITSKFIKE